MKKLFAGLSISALAFVAATTTSFAEDKVVTVTGEGQCGKCSLKETKSCQNVIKAKEDGKTVVYYLAANDVSKKFHGEICSATKPVKAKGTVKEVDGKKELTITEIELVKK